MKKNLYLLSVSLLIVSLLVFLIVIIFKPNEEVLKPKEDESISQGKDGNLSNKTPPKEEKNEPKLPTSTEKLYRYPIKDSAPDPFVTFHDGYYYMTFTQVDRIDIYKSANLANIADGEIVRAFTPDGNGMGTKNIWAPELHFIDGKWYLYYTADDGNDFNHRMYVLENDSQDPMTDTWEAKGEVQNMPNHFAIDGSTFEHNGTRYFVWSNRDGSMRLWMDSMVNPWTIRGEPVIISNPIHPWEGSAGYVNEGPGILKRNGRIFMTFSASGCQSPNYTVGLLTATDTADLLNPESWVKSPEPVFQKSIENDVYGPGHNSFTTSPDGTEDWMVYHANSSPDAGCTGLRSARVQKIKWNDDGTPDFGIPNRVELAPNCPAARYEGKDAIIHNAELMQSNAQASCNDHIGKIDFDDSYVEFSNVFTGSAGVHELTISFAHGMDTASHFVRINDVDPIEVVYPTSNWGQWETITIDVTLEKGSNKIIFTKGKNVSELDYISIKKKNS